MTCIHKCVVLRDSEKSGYMWPVPVALSKLMVPDEVQYSDEEGAYTLVPYMCPNCLTVAWVAEEAA